MEYLIKTYTNENETVLDFTMGSGTTGVACKNLNRKFIGIELDTDYFNIAKDRINNSKITKEVLEKKQNKLKEFFN
jgi:site-specific DNA-methyltransferase (adenine-specific)